MATGFERRITSLENRLKAIKKHLPTPTNENDSTVSVDEWRDMLIDFANTHTECKEYILQQDPGDRQERTMKIINQKLFATEMKAFALEQLEVVERQLATIDHDLRVRESSQGSKSAPENIQRQNKLMLELLTT